jgi:hypothetical protein
MLEKMKASSALPEYFIKALKATTDAIVAAPKLRATEKPPDWILLAHAAIKSDRWHCTTGCTLGTKRGTVLEPDYEGTDLARYIVCAPDTRSKNVCSYRPALQLPLQDKLVLGETVPLETFCVGPRKKCKLVDPPFMPEQSSGRRGRRGLIVVTNRMRDGDTMTAHPDEKVVRVFIHELACHAAPLQENRPWGHSDAKVAEIDKAVDEAFGIKTYPPLVPVN